MAETLDLRVNRAENEAFGERPPLYWAGRSRHNPRMETVPFLKAEGAGTRDAGVKRASALLRAHLEAPWTVARLSRSVGMSRATLARRFVAEYAESPMRHLARLRMDRAAELLARTDQSLARIAPQVGYDTEFALSRAFKRFFGVPPSAYRARLRSEPRSGSGTVCRAA
jgi:transcriptional regulator GlxA family with amidase domain